MVYGSVCVRGCVHTHTNRMSVVQAFQRKHCDPYALNWPETAAKINAGFSQTNLFMTSPPFLLRI